MVRPIVARSSSAVVPNSWAWVSSTWSVRFISPPTAFSTIPACRRAASATACRRVVISAVDSACGGRRIACSVSRMSLIAPDGPATTVTARSGEVATTSSPASS